jgi:hypothetical protein
MRLVEGFETSREEFSGGFEVVLFQVEFGEFEP